MKRDKSTIKSSEFYESYDEFIKDYAKYMQYENKSTKEIIEQNKQDIEYLREKYAE